MTELLVWLDSLAAVAVTLVGVAAVCFTFLMRRARASQERWYLSENVLGGILCPILTAMFVFGVANSVMVIQQLRAGATLSGEQATAALVLAAGFAIATFALARNMPVPLESATVTQLHPNVDPQPPRVDPAKFPRAA